MQAQDVARLLEAAGSAVKALTVPSKEPDGMSETPSDMRERKEAFTAATSQYFQLLSSIDVGVRRQILALEEAGIIPAEAVSKSSQLSQSTSSFMTDSGPISASKVVIKGGGLGSLDIGWLNSRNDRVGREKEASLWEEAVVYAEKLLDERKASHHDSGRSTAPPVDSNGDLAMDGT